MTVRDDALFIHKAADAIGGRRADSIGSLIEKKRTIANSDLGQKTLNRRDAMEELIVLLINLIGKMMSPKPPARQAQPGRPPMLPSTPQKPSGHGGAAYKPIPGARAVPPSRAVVKIKAAPPRRGRRPQPPPVMMAAPILTGLIENAPPAPPMVRPAASRATTTSPAVKPPPALNAAAFRSWLTPTSLRQQFLLTEIFQPPLTMRQPREI